MKESKGERKKERKKEHKTKKKRKCFVRQGAQLYFITFSLHGLYFQLHLCKLVVTITFGQCSPFRHAKLLCQRIT